MRLHSYRDESHSRHFDLIGGGGHPWSIDLVSVTASAILVVGFACALMAHLGPLGFLLPRVSMSQQASVGGRAGPRLAPSGYLSMEIRPPPSEG